MRRGIPPKLFRFLALLPLIALSCSAQSRLWRIFPWSGTIESDPERGLQFPLTIDVTGGATQVDENIAVAGVHGSIQVLDAQATELHVDLSGGFSGLFHWRPRERSRSVALAARVR